MVKYMLMIFLLFSVSVSDANDTKRDELKTYTKTGYATYYAKKFEGRRTTSGERYRAKKFTAAHLNLPFGTIVTVTNLDNGRSVEVKVNDRGPFSKKFMIDLSEGAARELGFYRKGSAKVEMTYELPVEEEKAR